MAGFIEVLLVAGLFIMRIGLPLVLLIVTGTFIDRAYRRREAGGTQRAAVELPQYERQSEEASL